MKPAERRSLSSSPPGGGWLLRSLRSLSAATIVLALLASSHTARLQAQTIVVYPHPIANPGLGKITAGPDGNLWFPERIVDAIGRITPAGVLTELPIPSPGPSNAEYITTGSDGNLWFTDASDNSIVRLTPAGVFTRFPIPTLPSDVKGITAGPDGALWFAENQGNKIGRISTAGAISEFPLPTAGSSPWEIVAGADGNLWFTERAGNRIGRVTTTGSFTEFAVPTPGSDPIGLAAGPDGNIWFTELVGGKVGRITTAGAITEYPIPAVPPVIFPQPKGITPGPEGNLWFCAEFNRIGRITTSGSITLFPTPMGTGCHHIANGPDGNVWFTWNAFPVDHVGKVVFPLAITTTSPLPNGIVGSAYGLTLATSGGNAPFTWQVVIGSLPAGLTLGLAGGDLSGTPMAAGTSSFTVEVTDLDGVMVRKAFSLTVFDPLVITTPSPLPTGRVGDAYNVTFAATGGVAPLGNWQAVAGAFPPGLTLDPATGNMTGTPLGHGNFAFTIEVSDSTVLAPITTQESFELTIDPRSVLEIPTLDGWGLALMSLLLAGGAWSVLRRRGASATG